MPIKTKKILIVHPEGNITNNPNLYGIVEILTEKGFHVDVKCFKRDYYQNLPFINAKLLFKKNIFERKYFNKFIIRPKLFLLIRYFLKYMLEYDKDYAFIMGVDTFGIIEAEIIAKSLKVPYGLISYEILFEEEVGSNYKYCEKKACENISFAICQDEVRSRHLSAQNSIPEELIIKMPVAGREKYSSQKNNYLRENLLIPADKKIAIYAGAISDWGMTDKILNELEKWPDNWVMVLHSRYSLTDKSLSNYKHIINTKLFISSEPASTFNDLSKILASADLGLGFYKNTGSTYLSGNNIKYLGLSSGKLSMYLQNNLPIATNNIGIMSDFILNNKLGFVVNDISELPEKLSYINAQSFDDNCSNFFKHHLSLDNTITPMLKTIDGLIGNI